MIRRLSRNTLNELCVECMWFVMDNMNIFSHGLHAFFGVILIMGIDKVHLYEFKVRPL